MTDLQRRTAEAFREVVHRLAPVFNDVTFERINQDAQWGQQNHPNGTGRPGDLEMAAAAKARCQANDAEADNWRDILDEEVWEAFAETDPRALRAELIQAASVIVAWVEAIDRAWAAAEEARRGLPQ